MRGTLFVITAIAILGSVNLYGFQGYKYAKWWKNSEIVKQLDLTSDQVNQIEKIFVSDKEYILKLTSNLKVKQKHLRSLISNPNSNREDVLILNDEVDQLKSSLKRVRLDMLLQIRDVLSPEQRIKLREIEAKRRKLE